MARAGLDRAVIVRATLDLLDAGGIDAVTARAIAERLGVRAGALYYHVPDMRTLLDETATLLLREMLAEPLTAAGWEQVLRGMADRMRRVLLGHRDGARVFAGSRVTDAGLLPAMEAPLAVLTGAGLSLEQAFWAMQTVLHLTVGFVIEEQHRQDEEPEAYRIEARLGHLDATAAPLTAAATGPMMAAADRQFAFGVELVIAGVATLLPPPRAPARRAR